MLAFSWCWMGQAQAAVTGGVLTFGTNSGLDATPVPNMNGLDFQQNGGWMYMSSSSGGTPTADGSYILTQTAGQPLNPGKIGVLNAGDRFNVSSVAATMGSPNAYVKVTGYRGGTPVVSQNLTMSAPDVFTTYALTGFTNIDTIGFEGSSDWNWGIDTLVVAPYIGVSPAGPTLTAGAVGTAYSQTFTGSGGTSYTYAVTSGALPAGLSLNSSTGVLSGTPTTAGTANFTITATDASSYTGSTAYSLTIAPNITLSPVGVTLPAATVGTAYSQSFTASAGTAPYSYGISAGALPAGLSLSSTGLLSGIPSAGGTFNFTVTATDASSATGSKAYSLTVGAPSIVFSPSTLTAGSVGVAYSQTVSASGGTAPYGSFALQSGALPAGLSLNSSGTISGTPTAAGTFTFTVRATDSSTGNGPYTGTSSTISLTIGAPSLAFSPSTLTAATVGAAYSQTISVTGGTAPYGNFSLASGSLPLGLSLNSSGTVSGTPTQGGTFTFTVQATDSSTGTGAPFSGTSTTLSLTVAPPTISMVPASLPAVGYGTAYSQTISASGGTAPYTFSISGGTLPTGLSLSSGGVLSGSTTQSGSYPITVTATDSSATPYSKNTAYTLTVNPQMPVAGNVSATVVYNTATPITLNLSGGTATSVAVATGASNGTATASGTSITYTPTTGYSGSDSFTYTATNASGTSAPATVTITVNPQMAVAGAVSATVAYNSSANP
ncbi:MAG TPA: putative Ig domain-containing protein, partial [Azospira sp.]|nr:putative Ig domain-containing protein [Azospira sp.]